MREVEVRCRPIERFSQVTDEDQARYLVEQLEPQAGAALGDRAVLNVNSTEAGGGVAEMLPVLLGYVLDAGVEARWLVIDGHPAFFTVTKRIHNHLYGSAGDGGSLGESEHRTYRATLEHEADPLAAQIEPGDIVLIHDPQPAGLAERAREAGGIVIWRCHVGVDVQDSYSERAWGFLRPYLEPHVHHYVFTRREFAPGWIPQSRLSAVPPSIDPFSPKNQELAEDVVESILTRAGLIAGRDVDARFLRGDGTAGTVDRAAEVVRDGTPPAPDTPLVTQVSRWDPMKDMVGVLRGFVEHVDPGREAHLVLAGPAVAAVSDDPEAASVLEDCTRQWEALPDEHRRRVTLAFIPMADLDENAAIINALQRHSAVVVQKSLAEGFGLTVVEALLKGRPVVASAVGGIRDQIVDGETGLLIEDPSDLEAFGRQVSRILDDPDLAARLGARARETAIAHYLGDTHLEHWLDVLRTVLAEAARESG